MTSPWLIQTGISAGNPAKIPSPLSTTTEASPYSRLVVARTLPPRSWASSCMP